MGKLVLFPWNTSDGRQSKEPTPIFPHSKLQKKLHKDLSSKAGLSAAGFDLLTFLKTSDFAGLLGERFFAALDQDCDGLVTLHEFQNGLQSIYTPQDEKTAVLLFAMIDFNEKGYATRRDVQTLLEAAAPQDDATEDEQRLKTKEILKETFKEKQELDISDLRKYVQSSHALVECLCGAVISGLPRVFDAAFAPWRLDCCECACSQSLMVMTVDGEKCFVECRFEALLGFSNSAKERLKWVILLRDAFAEAVDETSVFLGNCQSGRIFRSESAEERQRLIDFVNVKGVSAMLEKFQILGQVAVTGNSSVARGVQKGTSRFVAIKTIPKRTLSRKADLAVRREIRISSALQHPNVLPLLEVFETKDEIYLITEYMNEGSLFDYMESRDFAIGEAAAQAFARDIAQGLDYLHSHGIVHRDIKPENILLASGPQGIVAKISDFGLSCALGPEQCTAESLGTLKYAAPEVISRLPYREKVDCWSFGVLLYVLLRGSMPFGGKTDEDIAFNILKRKIRFSSSRWEGISLTAVAVLSGLLCRDPRQRVSAREALESEWLRDPRRQ